MSHVIVGWFIHRIGRIFLLSCRCAQSASDVEITTNEVIRQSPYCVLSQSDVGNHFSVSMAEGCIKVSKLFKRTQLRETMRLPMIWKPNGKFFKLIWVYKNWRMQGLENDVDNFQGANKQQLSRIDRLPMLITPINYHRMGEVPLAPVCLPSKWCREIRSTSSSAVKMSP